MAIIVEAPNELKSLSYDKHKSVFIGGGITNCGEWQFDLCNLLKNIPSLIVYNPRRKAFDGDAKTQIVWEYNKLMLSDMIVMLFCKSTLCPICLYETGRWINSGHRPAFIAIETGYTRTEDVIIQTQLARPDLLIAIDEIPILINKISEWINDIVPKL